MVDKLLQCAGTFRSNQQVDERVMDSGDIEKERGITILAKNCAVEYEGIHINIIDTPGHADFGGEVERVLSMVDGVLLLVDAVDGPMPQTRFVTRKALAAGLKPIVVINKVDRPGARPEWVVNQTFDLFDKLGATEDQLDFPVIYASALEGYAGYTDDVEELKKIGNMRAIFDTVIKYVPVREDNTEAPLQLQICSLDYNSYVGKIGIGRVHRGVLKAGQNVVIMNGPDDTPKAAKINQILQFEGLDRKVVDSAQAGDIVLVNGIEDLNIGTTITDPAAPEALPMLKVDEPTLTMNFMVNTSPLAGREGKFVTSRQIRERLERELKSNVAMRLRPTADETVWEVCGRGELHLTILLENMRREGYELQVGQPKVIIKQIDGQKCEPVEELTIDIPEEYSGRAIELVTKRKGTMTDMTTVHDRQRIVFDIPSRGIIGLRSNLLTATAGEAVMSHRLKGFEPYKGDMEMRQNGSLIAMETGTAYAYAINKLQDRGTFFVSPQDEIYAGQVVGESTRSEDIVINLTKSKKLTNMRASGSDDKVSIAPPVIFSLEEALEYIKEDEYVEVTPKSIRLRKIILDETMRKRQAK